MTTEIDRSPIKHIFDLIDDDQINFAVTEILKLAPADIAEIIEDCPIAILSQIFIALPQNLKPDVLSELDTEIAAAIVEMLPSETASSIFTEMDPDDAADVLSELNSETQSEVIEGMDDDEADDVRMLMSYPEDSAGGIMTTDLISMSPDHTIRDVLDAITGWEEDDHVHQVYVVSSDNKLLGIVSIWKLLCQKNRATPLSNLMTTQFQTVHYDLDQEAVARLLAKYDLSVIPVVNDDNELLGRVTSDDVIDVIQEEAEEDIFRLAGSDDEELHNTSIFKSCMIRLPWLCVTLLGGCITASLLTHYTQYFKSVLVLASFIPNVMAMGGNTGLQSSILLVREIATGTTQNRALNRLIFHELRTGALMGFICGTGLFLLSTLIISLQAPSSPDFPPAWELGTVVGVSLFAAMSFASAFGAVIPLVLHRFKIDPAVASGPFISVINDISALLIYYAISFFLIFRILV